MDLAQARRHSVLCEFIRPYQSHEDIGGFDAEAMADRIVRLERILHALREPSEAVSRVVRREWHLDTTPDDLIWFAVITAEQEVGDA
jgi:hypothetical protein